MGRRGNLAPGKRVRREPDSSSAVEEGLDQGRDLVRQLLVDAERAASQHAALDIGQRGERVHLGARAARRVLAEDDEHRNFEPSRAARKPSRLWNGSRAPVTKHAEAKRAPGRRASCMRRTR
jgi:hypothetical protein